MEIKYRNPNCDRVKEVLRQKDMTREELMQVLDMRRTTVFNCLKFMKDAGEVHEYSKKVTVGPGRPNTFWKVDDIA
jgi:predicted ArsR family transcriptional regulator